jgi:lipoprotein-anchoring transpeptidase ErfK/SrfK
VPVHHRRDELEGNKKERETMIMARMLRRATLAAGSLLALAGLGAEPASAQLFWDWSGGTRENVRVGAQYKKGEIIVSFGDRRLYFVNAPGEAISYPIAVPREQSRWEGVTSVTQKRVNPSWTPTPTMIAENPRLPRWVPGGHPMNPLGVRALYLGSSTYRIHGTDAPWTIGSAVSKGCIRMYNEDVEDLYPRANVGAKVTVTYRRFDFGSSGGPAPSASNGSGGGSFFSLFGGYDGQPQQEERPRRKRATTKDKSASAN